MGHFSTEDGENGSVVLFFPRPVGLETQLLFLSLIIERLSIRPTRCRDVEV